jgi:hypothetical protein
MVKLLPEQTFTVAVFLLAAVSTVFKYESTPFDLFFNMKYEAAASLSCILFDNGF